VSKNQQALIAPLERHTNSLRSGERKILLIPDADNFTHLYTVSARIDRAHPRAIKRAKDRLYIHKKVGSESTLIATIMPDDFYELTDRRGILYCTVSNLGNKDGTIKAAVKFLEDSSAVEEINFQTGFPAATTDYSPNKEHNGTWYNPFHTSQGLDFRVKGDNVAFIWYTFEESGDRKVYVTEGVPLGQLKEGVNLYRATNGTFENPGESKLELEGTAQFYNLGTGNAVLNFNTIDEGINSIELTHLSKSFHPRDGWFYDPQRNGEGFSIHHIPGAVVVYWYTFIEEKHPIWGYPKKKQEWYMSTIDINADSDLYEGITGEFKHYINGSFMDFKQTEGKVKGALKLRFHGLNNITVIYDHNDYGPGRIEAKRLF